MAQSQAVSLNASRILETVGTPPKQTWDGIYAASCVQNNDPLNEGRITMYVPQVLGMAVSNWATPLGFGNVVIPSPGQMVHAYFLGGDVNHPVYACINLSTVNNDITTVQSSITTVQGQISSVNTDITDIDNTITGLYVGAWTPAELASGISASGSGVNGLWYRTVPILNSVEIMGDIMSSSTGSPSIATLTVGDLYSSVIPENFPAGLNQTYDYSGSSSVTAASPPWIYVLQESSDSIGVYLIGVEVANTEIFFHIFTHGDSLS